eukprot:scaffold7998_cov417-Prasinococcus_capsulatus_cf.AAC.12
MFYPTSKRRSRSRSRPGSPAGGRSDQARIPIARVFPKRPVHGAPRHAPRRACGHPVGDEPVLVHRLPDCGALDDVAVGLPELAGCMCSLRLTQALRNA